MKQIEKMWVTDEEVRIRTVDGYEASESIEDYPRLRDASPDKLQD